MEFSEVINFLEKLNDSKELQSGYHFLIDGNFIYCFLVKSISYNDPYTYFVGFSNPQASPVPTMTYAYNYEMELINKIKLNRNENGKLKNALNSMKELMNFCKAKNLKKIEFYDEAFEEFLKNVSNKDLLESI